MMRQSQKAFDVWRVVPAPGRGEIVRQIAVALREKKQELGTLIAIEMGKILTEGLGEVQEMIDICDFAVGLSRTFAGPTLPSERPGHRLMEQWHPLGTIGVISAFNFPMAVWSWNAALGWVCGDTVVWKPSSKAPLSAIACQNVVNEVFRANGAPEGVSSIIVGRGSTVGQLLIRDKRIPLISSTGSMPMGKRIGEVVVGRLGRVILELGGNNALIVSDKADMKGALAAAFFGAVGTAGQRCTSTRRLIIHEKIYKRFLGRLIRLYEKVTIGDPLNPKTLMGPLIDEGAVADYENGIAAAKEQGGRVLYGAKVLRARFGRRTFVQPTIIEIDNGAPIVQSETFAPIPVRHEVQELQPSARDAQQGSPGPVFGCVHRQCVRSRNVRQLPGFGLRHRQHQRRDFRGGDRRCLRWREGDRRRARIGVRRVESLHAPSDEYRQLGRRHPPGSGRGISLLEKIGTGTSVPISI